MALLDTSRARLQPTPAERLALTVAAWISLLVAQRIERRHRRATSAHAAQVRTESLAAARDENRARAYLLGIR